ncbi:hypothetical protein DY000_02049580 [Brassica cretica]|uniref:Uncharacterized protein n=1 Tax=Brassica cretica TaxID=69181 RepID=A0ABQ7EYD3_BRACR|nr:hypothetical protein DY000_02049580 [Brassica cretica]
MSAELEQRSNKWGAGDNRESRAAEWQAPTSIDVTERFPSNENRWFTIADPTHEEKKPLQAQHVSEAGTPTQLAQRPQ